MPAYPLGSTTLFSDANLISYYPLDGDSTDAKGANDGTDTVISYNASYGKFSQGADFTNASSSSINLGTPANLQFSTAYTVLGWVYLDNAPGGGRYLWAKWDTVGGVNTRTIGIYTAGDRKLYFSQSADGVNSTDIASTTALSLDAWHLVATTWDGTKTHLYIDGAEEGTGASITGLKSSPNCRWGIGAALGRAGDPTSAPFDDYLDDVAFFNRALTLTEISDHYDGSNYSPSTAIKDMITPGMIPFPR